MKDIHDFGPSDLIRSSQGPENELQKFYSTTYSLAHKSYKKDVEAKNRPRSRSIKTKNVPTIIKRKTGYTSNLNSYVTYDRDVDEKDFKIGMDAYVSSTVYSHKAPVRPITVKESTAMVVPAKYDSGFTHLPLRKAVHFSPGDFNSLMSSSYTPNVWTFKSSSHDKSKILSSLSAFVTDRGEIRSLGDDSLTSTRQAQIITSKKEKIPKNTFQLKEDGFSRSGPHTILRDGYTREQIMPRIDSKSVQKLKKIDSPTLIDMLDPKSTESTSHIVHHLMNPVKDTLELQKSGIIIGNKEMSSSVKDSPVKLPEIEAHPEDRFSTETSRRFSYPAFKLDIKDIDCGIIRNSAFARNFAYRYTKPAKTDEEIYKSLHPSVAKGLWAHDNGLRTAKPTRTSYTLVIE